MQRMHITQHQKIPQTTQLKNEQRIWTDIFPKKTYRWPTGTWKKCSMWLIIREMRIKTTVRYHLTPVRMAIIKKTRTSSVGKHVEKREPSHCWWECKLVQPLWKTVGRFLKKLKIELLYDPAIPLLGVYLKKTKTLIRKDICIPVFTAALFTIVKIWKQPNYPSIKRVWCWVK